MYTSFDNEVDRLAMTGENDASASHAEDCVYKS
jgi:hypothetical protein